MSVKQISLNIVIVDENPDSASMHRFKIEQMLERMEIGEVAKTTWTVADIKITGDMIIIYGFSDNKLMAETIEMAKVIQDMTGVMTRIAVSDSRTVSGACGLKKWSGYAAVYAREKMDMIVDCLKNGIQTSCRSNHLDIEMHLNETGKQSPKSAVKRPYVRVVDTDAARAAEIVENLVKMSFGRKRIVVEIIKGFIPA